MTRRTGSSDTLHTAGRTGRKLDLTGLLLDLVTCCNQSVDFSEALQGVIDKVCTAGRYVVGHAYLIDKIERQRLRSSQIFNRDVSGQYAAFCHRTASLTFRFGEGLVGRAAAENAVVVMIDFPTSHLARSQAAADAGLKTAIAIPIAVNGEVMGALEFFSATRANVDMPLANALTAAATQLGHVLLRDERLAASVSEARMAEEARRRDASIEQIGGVVEQGYAISSTLDLIAAKITTELDVDAAHILLCDSEDEQFELMPTVSPAVREIHFPTERHRSDPARRAALDGAPVHIDDVRDLEPHEALPGYMCSQGVRSYYAIPLHGDGVLNGVLELCGKLPRSRDANWLSTLSMFAEQTATALAKYRAA